MSGRHAATDPFAVLGLSAADELGDDDVRAAWRRIAAATHPDRADGGDPGVFAAAAAAYTDLRTAFGRGEARAVLAGNARRRTLAWPRRPAGAWTLLLKVLAAGAVIAAVAVIAGPGPAGPALVTGVLTWLVLAVRHDARPP